MTKGKETTLMESNNETPNDGNGDEQQPENGASGGGGDGTRVEAERHEDRKPRKWWCKQLHFWDVKFSTSSQFLFSLFLVVIGAAQALIYSRQTKIIDGQLHEMRAEQRAWVSLAGDPEEGGSLGIGADVRAKIKFALQNTGRNPAVSIFLHGETSIAKVIPFGSMPAWQKAICNEPTGGIGFTLFPNATTMRYDAEFGLREDERKAREHAMPQFTAPAVIAGCIIYTDAVSGITHHTPLAYQTSSESGRYQARPWIRGVLPPD